MEKKQIDTDYSLLAEQIKALSDGVEYEITILANASALLYEMLPDLNWCGFYLVRCGELQLGPFQGKTACIRIPFGKGVCGTAVRRDDTVLVYDVHEFPGHIACDSASNSEIVIPLHRSGRIYGVLDIDSPLTGRFTQEDREGLENIVKILENALSLLS